MLCCPLQRGGGVEPGHARLPDPENRAKTRGGERCEMRKLTFSLQVVMYCTELCNRLFGNQVYSYILLSIVRARLLIELLRSFAARRTQESPELSSVQ